MGFKAIILAVLLVSTVYLDILAHAKYLLLQIDEVQPNPAPPLQPTPAPKPPSPSNVLEEGQRCGGRREVVHGISCGKGLKCVGTAVHWDGQGTCRRTGSNCPNNDAVGCREDPCDFATCSVDSATCVSNYCGACNAVFYDETGQNEVQCQEAKPTCGKLGAPCIGHCCDGLECSFIGFWRCVPKKERLNDTGILKTGEAEEQGKRSKRSIGASGEDASEKEADYADYANKEESKAE